MITQTQVTALDADGFLVLPGAFSLFVINRLIEGFDDVSPAHAQRNLLTRPAVHDFATSREALQFIEPILGPNAFPTRGILFDKLPDANWKVAWHQDLSIAVKARHPMEGFGPWSTKEGITHVQPPLAILEKMLTLRLHLDDCFEDNGPVRVLPTSHRQGVLNPDRILQLRAQHTEVLTTTGAGGLLLMRPLLLHA